VKFTAIIASLLLASSTQAAYEITETNVRNPQQTKIKGFKDTPKQPAPNDKWHVHDPDRTQPPVAEPKYDGKPVAAPKDGKMLFDGSSLDNWKNKKWDLKDGIMTASRGDQHSNETFRDIQLHVEWMAPLGRKGWGQAQGNSGVFLMGRYEVQVLNCWGNRTYPDGMTGAIYAQNPPKYNVCKKPGEWQSYDIHFKAPVFKDKKLVTPAYITVFLNGVKIHDNYEIKGTTHYRRIASYGAHKDKEPIKLQAHGNPVKYRNIWVAPLKMKLGK